MKKVLENENIKNKVSNLKDKYKENEKYAPAVFFLFGFIFDIATLGEVDDFSNLISLTIYLILSAFFIYCEIIEFKVSENAHKYVKTIFEYSNDIFHFVLGALLSAFTLFYFKSSSLSNSFLFMLLMFSLLILNETQIFQKKGIFLKSSLFKICQISYLIYLIPLILGKIGFPVFLFSAILSLAISFGTFKFLSNKRQGVDFVNQWILPHVMVACIFLILYVFKAIPPIPLSLKSIGIYHGLEKKEGKYILQRERSFWKFWQNGDQDFYYRNGDKAYVFSRIFSPGGFEGKVYLHWEKEFKSGYKTTDKIPLTLTGGRGEGFRAFAYKRNLTPGAWRVKVETHEGLEIGRINFNVIEDNSTNEKKYSLIEF